MSALVHHVRRRLAPLPVDRRLRARIEATIEQLIATLDAIDGDPDLEDGADTEPNFGGYHVADHLDECEAEDEGDELDAGESDEAEAIDLWLARL